jgi:type I restriction enzyme S subunit
MNRYESYKESDIKWIENIPTSWKTKKLKFLGTVYGGLTGKKGDDFGDEDNPNSKPYIPYTNIFKNTRISIEHFDCVVIEKDEKQNLVKKNDLLILMSSENYEDLGKSSILINDCEELYLNSFCKVFRITKENINPGFINYQLLGDLHKKLISLEGNGFTRINLRQDKLLNTPILIPSLKEQNKIVEFLDNKTHQIDRLINKKERKTELLKEKLLFLVERVLVDKNIKREKIKHVVDLVKRPIKRNPTEKYNKVGMYNWGRGIFKYPDELGSELGDSTFNYIKERDLLLSGQFSWEGSVSIVQKQHNDCISSHRFHILNGHTNTVLNEYLWSYFISQEGHWKLDSNSFGSGGRNRPLNINKLLNEKIPIPNIDIQRKIRDCVIEFELDKKYKKRKTKLLKEFKQSLISEVVTGKKRVI